MKPLIPKLTPHQLKGLATYTIWQQVAMARDLADKTGKPVILPNGCRVHPTHFASKAEESLMQAHLAAGFTAD